MHKKGTGQNQGEDVIKNTKTREAYEKVKIKIMS
jgi:hypothetical protein